MIGRRRSRGANTSRELPLVAELDNKPGGLGCARLEDDGDTIAAHLDERFRELHGGLYSGPWPSTAHRLTSTVLT